MNDSVLVHLEGITNRGLLRAFLNNAGGHIQYEYGILPNVVNVRGLPPGLLVALSRVEGVVEVEEDAQVSETLAESIPLIRAVQGTDVAYDGSGVRVCVIDGGIEETHPMFTGRVSSDSWDFVNGDPNPADDTYHGTHVAGIAAGAKVPGNNNTFQGVAPGATIVAAKALANGTGSFSDIIAAIDYCAGTGQRYASNGTPQGYISQPADVINMSLGGIRFTTSCDASSLASAANAAVDHGLVVIAASGNDASANGINTPACGSKVIAVGATYDASFGGLSYSNCVDINTAPDQIACFSNQSNELDVVAPGAITTSAGPDGGVASKAGTSMATPHVAGLAALILDKDPSMSPSAVRDCIRTYAVDLGPSGFDPAYGYGRIDVKATLDACGGPSPNTPPTVAITYPTSGSSFDSNTLISFTGSALDTEDGYLGNAIKWSSNLDGAIGTGAQISAVLSDGQHTITAAVTDSGGITRTDTATIEVVPPAPEPSNTPPTVAITSPASGSSFDSNTLITFAGSASDTEDGYLGNAIVWRSNLDGAIGTGAQISAVLSDGQHTITAEVTDSGGITRTDSATIEVVPPAPDPNNTPPTISIVYPTSGSSFDSGIYVTLAGTASDAEDGYLSPSMVWTSNIDGTIGTGGQLAAPLSDGVHTITAEVTDSGGMTRSDQVTIEVVPDGNPPPNTPPTVSISSPASGSTFDLGTPVLFSGSASDSEDGNLSSAIAWTSSIDGNLGVGASFSKVLSEGTHTVTAQVTDSGGVTKTAQVTVEVVDNTPPPNTPPSVSISSPASGSTFDLGTPILFSGSASDSEDGNLSSTIAWTSSINGNLGTGASFSKVLSEGTHTVTAQVTDSGGVTKTAQVTVEVVDNTPPPNTPPSVSITYPINSMSITTTTSITFTGTASDNEDGNLSGSIQWTSNLDGNIGTGPQFNTVLSSGHHTITAAVIDSGGMTGSDAISVDVIAVVPGGVPAAPSKLSAQLEMKGAQKFKWVNLSWRDNSDDEDVFLIERCSDIGTSGGKAYCRNWPSNPIAIVSANQTSTRDTSAGANQTYIYRVRARNDYGTSEPSNEPSNEVLIETIRK